MDKQTEVSNVHWGRDQKKKVLISAVKEKQS